ncbi:MAG TPA: TIGR04255 family protein, partial [Tenuifilaceae bacterium]|nr:TIGR04255 family protein [Tenuifilaceae bacterium]
MSKLPKAPLVEVVFELRWQIINKVDLSKIPYLYGDIYSQLKNKYPFRESIVPPEIPIDILINQPVHRFRTAPNDYPLFQVGTGIITLNT